MLISANEILTDALRLIRAIGAVDIAQGNDAVDGVRILNDVIEQLSLERQMTRALRQEAVTWPAFAAFRGIGEVSPLPPGSFNIPRPLRIEKANYLSGTSEIYLQVIQQDQFADYRSKDTNGPPRYLYYRPDMPQGTIFLLPIPVVTTTVNLFYMQVMATFAEGSSQLDLAPGLRKVLVYNCAVEMAPQWTGRAANQTVQAIAIKSKADYKRNNVQELHLPQDSNFPVTLNSYSRNRTFSIREGDQL
jgi:hypothetical protein